MSDRQVSHIRRWALHSALAAVGLLALAGAADPAGRVGGPALRQLAGALHYLLVALCVKPGVVALTAWIAARKPGRVAAARDVYLRSPIKSFIIGVLTFVVGFAVAAILGALMGGAAALGVVFLPVFLFVMTLFFYALFVGLGGIYQQLGTQMRRQSAPDDAFEPTYIDALKGGALIETATLVPLIGWLITIYLAYAGLGASVLAWLLWRRQRTLQLRPEAAAPAEKPSETDGDSEDV